MRRCKGRIKRKSQLVVINARKQFLCRESREICARLLFVASTHKKRTALNKATLNQSVLDWLEIRASVFCQNQATQTELLRVQKQDTKKVACPANEQFARQLNNSPLKRQPNDERNANANKKKNCATSQLRLSTTVDSAKRAPKTAKPRNCQLCDELSCAIKCEFALLSLGALCLCVALLAGCVACPSFCRLTIEASFVSALLCLCFARELRNESPKRDSLFAAQLQANSEVACLANCLL